MLFSIKNLEIFAVGEWNGDTYSQNDLVNMVKAFDKVGFKPPLKLGHTENQKFLQKDGLPAAGWIDRIFIKGGKLLADVSQIPKKIYELLQKGAYKHVSSEIYWNLKRNNDIFPRALKAVALLGAETPAVSGLTPIDKMLAQYLSILSDSAEFIKAYSFESKNEFSLQQQELISSETDLFKTAPKKYNNNTEDCLENNKQENNKGDNIKMTIEELQAQMKELKKELTNKDKELKETVTNFETALKDKDTEVLAISKDLEAIKQQGFITEAKIFTSGLLKAGKIAPVVVPAVERLLSYLSNTDTVIKQHTTEGTKETTILDFTKKIFSDMPVIVDFNEKAEASLQDKEDNAISSLDKKIKDYAEKHKISYSEATIPVLADNPSLAKEYYAN